MNNLNTSEKIAELRLWVLNDEGLYLGAKHLNELVQEGIEINISEFMFYVANTASIFIKPSEIDAANEALLKLVKEIDQ